MYNPTPNQNYKTIGATNTTLSPATVSILSFSEVISVDLPCKNVEKIKNTPGSGANILLFVGAIFVVVLCNKSANIIHDS